MSVEENWKNEELLKRVENAAREGAIQGVKECGGAKLSIVRGGVAKSLLKLVLILVGIIVIVTMIGKFNPFVGFKNMFSQESDVEDHDMTFENNGFLGYTVADFEEVILGDSSKLKKLEVYSQEMSQMVQMTQAGLGKLKIFSKSKYYTYHGTAIYTVDLSKLTKDSIKLDEEDMVVELLIPHAEMTTLDIPQDKMEIGDTQKGVLAFGELSMTDEQSKEIMAQAREDMSKQLLEDKVHEQADQIAKLTVWELYQPLITKMAKGYSLKVEFEEIVTE